MRLGLLAEFEAPETLVRAAAAMRDGGYSRMEAHTPFPVAGLAKKLGHRRSRITIASGLAALLGAGLAYSVQLYTSAIDYPLIVGGRPPHAPPAFVPITFEMGVLACALATFVALIVACRLTALWHPLFEVEGFERVSIDRFFLRVDRTDPRFDLARTADELTQLGATRVVAYGGSEP